MTAATGRKGTIVPLSISSAGLWVVSLLALLSVMGCDALGSGPSAEETDAAQKELETAQLELDTALKQISSLKTQVSEANAKAKSAETAAASGRISLEQAELNVRIYAQNNLGVYSLQFQEVQLV